MPLTLVKNFPDRLYAERARQSLEEEGIIAVIQSPDPGFMGVGGSAAFPQGADLYVEQKDASRARELLNELFDGI